VENGIKDKAEKLGLNDIQIKRLTEMAEDINYKMGETQSTNATVESLLDIALSFDKSEMHLRKFILNCEWAFNKLFGKKKKHFHKMRVGGKRF